MGWKKVDEFDGFFLLEVPATADGQPLKYCCSFPGRQQYTPLQEDRAAAIADGWQEQQSRAAEKHQLQQQIEAHKLKCQQETLQRQELRKQRQIRRHKVKVEGKRWQEKWAKLAAEKQYDLASHRYPAAAAPLPTAPPVIQAVPQLPLQQLPSTQAAAACFAAEWCNQSARSPPELIAGLQVTQTQLNGVVHLHAGHSLGSATHVVLQQKIGSGSHAQVFKAEACRTPVTTLSNQGGSNAESRTSLSSAAASALTDGTTGAEPVQHVAVKVFDVGSLARAQQEIRALELLASWPDAQVVQLLGKGLLPVTNTTAAAATAGLTAEFPMAAAQLATGPTASSAPQVCVVLELMDMSLADVLRVKQRVGEDTTRCLVHGLLSTLQTMHSGALGAVMAHRDIKPDNVLICTAGGRNRVKLCDFSCCSLRGMPAMSAAARRCALNTSASAGAAAVDRAKTGTPVCAVATAAAAADDGCGSGGATAMRHDIAGTPHYMSLACFTAAASTSRSQPFDDCSCDLYSLGVVTLEMLSGVSAASSAPICNNAAQILVVVETVSRCVQHVVDRQLPLPAGVVISAHALDFISCCCGVGAARDTAVSLGQPRQLSAAQLLQHPWMQAMVRS